MSIKRNAQGKIIAKRFTTEELIEADKNYGGFCIACGEEAYNVEPDARKYRCEGCEHKTVYGAAEIIIMGLVKD